MDEKIEIAHKLDELGIPQIEAGFPIVSENEKKSVKTIANEGLNAKIICLTRTKKEDIDAALDADVDGIITFMGLSDLHLKVKMDKPRDVINKICMDAVDYGKDHGLFVAFSAEDATRTEIGFLTKCVKTAIQAGATTINLPDTVGYCYPREYQKMFENVIKEVGKDVDISNIIFSTHCHNDLGMATANAISGTIGGARQIECCINGIGERAGNTAMEEVVMTFKVRKELGFDTNIDTKQIKKISDIIRDVSGFAIQPNKAIVGKNAFLHESGIHQDGVLKNKSTYEIIDPADVGIKADSIVLGKLSGRSALKAKIEEMGYHFTDEQINQIFVKFKEIAGRKKFVVEEDIERIMKDCGFIGL